MTSPEPEQLITAVARPTPRFLVAGRGDDVGPAQRLGVAEQAVGHGIGTGAEFLPNLGATGAG